MRWIVKSKPFSKKRPRYSWVAKRFSASQSKSYQGSGLFSLFFKKHLLLSMVTLCSILLLLFLLKGTWYNTKYLVQTIHYSDHAKAEYGNTELFVWTSKFLRGKYYSSLKAGSHSQLLQHVRKQYPFVKNVHLSLEGKQTLGVDYEFYSPDFLVLLGGQKYWIWKGGVSELIEEWWSLGREEFLVDTPSYLSDSRSLAGFFYKVDYAWYKEHIPLIQEAFPRMERFVYLAGSDAFVVFEDQKMIFLFKDDVRLQLQKLGRLQKYYADYEKISVIDLGSLMDDKIIIRKK